MFLLTDEDFDERIARAVRRDPNHTVESVRKYAPEGIPDGDVLDVAWRLNAILLTHDIHTMVPLVALRVASGADAPRVVLVVKQTPAALAAEHILVIAGAGLPSDWPGRVIYVPL